ncbi:aspartyl-phosphate phosphatase Spo0E family protein [Oceanobacillus damuensis]|uniref:aspartyl-phosphate phosphatase Spo0E family protein n=1 Tax=Oceanobacillus damuensis TaxID=937928 RepID=UPI000834234A|nr:aspartyl-phosphate phosphatase Spo0E family protein [Oceanobacillus damuensis]
MCDLHEETETTDYLLDLINHKRKMLLITAERFGIESEKTLICSQELDELIAKKQRMMKPVGQGLL